MPPPYSKNTSHFVYFSSILFSFNSIAFLIEEKGLFVRKALIQPDDPFPLRLEEMIFVCFQITATVYLLTHPVQEAKQNNEGKPERKPARKKEKHLTQRINILVREIPC